MKPTRDRLIVIFFLYLKHVNTLLPRELFTSGSTFYSYCFLVHRGYVKIFTKLKWKLNGTEYSDLKLHDIFTMPEMSHNNVYLNNKK